MGWFGDVHLSKFWATGFEKMSFGTSAKWERCNAEKPLCCFFPAFILHVEIILESVAARGAP